MACNLLPHNLREICDAIVHVIDHPGLPIADLLAIVPGPDFPTGGIICGRDGIVEGYTSGRGRLRFVPRSRSRTSKGATSRSSSSRSCPTASFARPSWNPSPTVCSEDRIKDISDVNDHSGREHAVRIVVDLKRDADPNVIINQLYQYTPCQITVSMINIALVNRQPRTMGLKELIQHFIEHRKEVITRRTRFLLKKAQQREHILEGLIYAVCDIDEVVRLIRSSKTREEAIAKLRQRAFRIVVTGPSDRFATLVPKKYQSYAEGVFPDIGAQERPMRLTAVQAEAIGALRLIQLVGLELEKLVDELKSVAEEIDGYQRILGDETVLMDIIREDIFELKEKYGDARRTEITGDVMRLQHGGLIAQEDVVVTVSHEG